MSSSSAPQAASASPLPARPLIGVAVLVCDPARPGCILVGERLGTHAAKTFATPGGHLEYGEEWEECGRREIKEETNLDLAVAPLLHVATTNNVFRDEGKHSVTLFLRGDIAANSSPLQLMEPEKCVEWIWIEWTELQRQARAGEIKVFPSLLTLLNDKNFRLQ